MTQQVSLKINLERESYYPNEIIKGNCFISIPNLQKFKPKKLNLHIIGTESVSFQTYNDPEDGGYRYPSKELKDKNLY